MSELTSKDVKRRRNAGGLETSPIEMGAITTTSFSETFNSDYKRQKTVARGRNQVKRGSERETELVNTEEDP